MISIYGKTTLDNGAVCLRTNVGEFCAKESGGLSADDNALELMFRCTATWRIFTANSVSDYRAGNKKLWRARNHYNEARDLAMLYMASEPDAVVAIESIEDCGTIFFANKKELKK